MEKHVNWIVSGIIVIAIIAITLGAFNKKVEKPFKKLDLKTTNSIVNITGRTYLDTILVTGLKYYGIENAHIVIKDIPFTQSIKDYNTILKGYVLSDNTNYILCIVDADKEESIHIVAHELIHFKQFHDRRLQTLDNTFIWNGKAYGSETEYDSRPWENEAFELGPILEIVLKQQLYGEK